MIDTIVFVAALGVLCYFFNDITSFVSAKASSFICLDDFEEKRISLTYVASPHIAYQTLRPLHTQTHNNGALPTIPCLTTSTPLRQAFTPANPNPQSNETSYLRECRPQLVVQVS
ncbi:hypothetical protein FRB93_003663 [Tulasnella sp. JGI-2019a]|nr:hypothetical protein FRB93_003663 [Tulasnella sp. JGI-2019a]